MRALLTARPAAACRRTGSAGSSGPRRLHLRAGLVDAVVQAEHRRAERRRARLAGRAELVGVGVAVGDAQAAHHRDQRDVDDVVVRPAAVRIAGEVLRRRAEQAAEQAEPVLRRLRGRRDRRVEAQHLGGDAGRPARRENAFGWLTPAMPVRNVVTRSVRGKLVGAMPGVASAISTSAGSVGLVT